MIRPALLAWHEATETLLALSFTEEEKRDETIARIEACLDIREQLQMAIVAPFTEAEDALGKELVVKEAEVQKKLALLFKQIRLDITQSQSKKDHMKNYINPYSKVARDGTFYDTKQ